MPRRSPLVQRISRDRQARPACRSSTRPATMRWMTRTMHPSDAMKNLYEKNMAGTYGAFTYGNSRFIALDSEHEPQQAPHPQRTPRIRRNRRARRHHAKDPRSVESRPGADTNLAHVFIFMHHPVVPYKSKTVWTRKACRNYRLSLPITPTFLMWCLGMSTCITTHWATAHSCFHPAAQIPQVPRYRLTISSPAAAAHH